LDTFEGIDLFCLVLGNRSGRHSNISWRTFQRITELVQNIGSVALASFVEERMESWISNAGLVLEFVARPAFSLKNFF
jgi:hypothetical protein